MDFNLVNWRELEAYVNDLKKSPYVKYDNRWEIIGKYPLTTGGIYQLQSEGLKLEFYRFSSTMGMYRKSPREKCGEIWINANLEGYARDVTLFHELGHAWFDFKAGYCFPDLLGRHPEAESNQAIIEWLGRQWRATPSLLLQAVSSFGLKGQIYDKASYEAFAKPQKPSEQFHFPFYEECSFTQRKTMMDGIE